LVPKQFASEAHEVNHAFESLGGYLYAATQTDFGVFSVTLPAESIAAATPLFGDPERAALAVSIAAGALAVGALGALLRAAFDRKVAGIGAFLLAVHPSALELADLQSDGLYLALFLASAALLWRAYAAASARDAFLAGLVAGLAYLTRPEGLGTLVVGAALAALEVARRHWSVSQAARFSGALVLGGVLVMSPYVAFLSARAGGLVLTGKKSVTGVLGLSAVLVKYQWLTWAVRVLGGAYLVYLSQTKRLTTILPVARRIARYKDSSDLPLLYGVGDQLLAASDKAAMDVWLMTGQVAPAGIFNGDFASPPLNHGFDWRLIESPGITHVSVSPGHRILLSGRQPRSSKHCGSTKRITPMPLARSSLLQRHENHRHGAELMGWFGQCRRCRNLLIACFRHPFHFDGC
jgi:hypothetical protein